MDQVVLTIDNLFKSYYPKRRGLHNMFKSNAALAMDKSMVIKAVDGVSLQINEGEIFGLLGSNGAGKSTILKMLCGLTAADSGSITLLGEKVDINNTKARENIGALIEQPIFFPKMSARRNLQYLGALNGNVTDKRIDEMAELFDIKDRLNDNMCTYSMGMYQKIGVIQAIMHKPKLLILDEPTNGLDPKWIIEVREILKRLAKDYHMTIIISSHILAEMQELCDRVAIIEKGKIVKSGSMEELLNAAQCGYEDIDYDVNDILSAVNIANNYNCRVMVKDSIMLVRIDKDKISEFNRDLILAGIMINGINVRKRKLEDVFRSATNHTEPNISDNGEDYNILNDRSNDASSGKSIDELIGGGIIKLSKDNKTDDNKSGVNDNEEIQ